MRLNELRDKKGAHKARSRVGRGQGSGKGRRCGRGQKGQNSRSGVSLAGFEGGQMPLYRRIPKRGFHNLFRRTYEHVNIGRLQKAIEENELDVGKTIDASAMARVGLISNNRDGVRLLGMGELSSKVNIEVAGASKSAISKIEGAGGKIILPKPTKSDLEAHAKSEKLRAKKGDASARNNAHENDTSADDRAGSLEE